MQKRVFLCLVLAATLAGGVFAQSHWISLEQKGPGAGLRYEYVLGPSFTLGGYFSYTYITIPLLGGSSTQINSVEFGAAARWYPFSRRLFTELSLGVNLFGYYNQEWSIYGEGGGFCFAPGFGWTIDLGKPGSFFISPGVKFPFTLGDRFNVTIAPYFGLGFAF